MEINIFVQVVPHLHCSNPKSTYPYTSSLARTGSLSTLIWVGEARKDVKRVREDEEKHCSGN